jgi:aspartate aminotransferase
MPLADVLSERIKEIEVSSIRKLLKILVEDKNIISLGPGEPDYTTPKHIINEMKKYLDKGYTHYSPVEGKKEFLEEVSKKLKRENGISVSENQIIATCGASEALLMGLMVSIDPGEQVMIPDPGFLAFRTMAEIINGEAVSYPLSIEDDFNITYEGLKSAAKEPKKLKAIIINTPSNPLGKVHSRSELEELADFAREYDLMIISDEAYEKFVYGRKHVSVGSLNGMGDYVLTVGSFSKSLGMAGFRIGFAAGPEKIINSMRNLHTYTTLCAPTISQMGVVAALKQRAKTDAFIKKNVREYDRRRKSICKRLDEIKNIE